MTAATLAAVLGALAQGHADVTPRVRGADGPLLAAKENDQRDPAKSTGKPSPTKLSARDIRRLSAILATGVDRRKLTATAEQLAASEHPEAVPALGRFLLDEGFLRRLDRLDVPDLKLAGWSHVLATLAAHPSQASEELALAMLADRDVQADPDRNNAILAVLASVRPMSEKGEQALRAANAAGHWHSNALLLMANASPRALALFAEMVADARVPTEDRVDAIRWAVPPHRHVRPVVECVAQLLGRRLEVEVDRALFEALFDVGGDRWYGKARRPPEPQPWSSVDAGVLRLYLDVGQQLVQKRSPLPPAMAVALTRTSQAIRAELAARGAAP